MLIYTVLRLGIFAVVLAVMLALQTNPVIAAIIAAIISLCVCYVLLPRQRAAVVQAVVDIRNRGDKDDDNDVENAVLDRETRETRAASGIRETHADRDIRGTRETHADHDTSAPDAVADDLRRDRP